jgi:hypothetical protein
MRKSRSGAAGLMVLAALLTGCQPQQAEPNTPAAVQQPADPTPSLGLQSYRGDGFVLRQPAGARVEIVEPLGDARSTVRILGPEVSVRAADQNFSWSGAAYDLEVRTFDNPQRLDAAAWATAHYPTPANLIEEQGPAEVAGYSAYRVVTFGGDSQWINLVVTHADRAFVFSYNDAPVQNNPLSEVARDAHAMLLGSFRIAGS